MSKKEGNFSESLFFDFWPRIFDMLVVVSFGIFRDSLDKYSWELQKVSTRLLSFMSLNLGLDSETLANVFENGRQSMRMNFYPPCLQASKVLGLSPHSDISGMTLLVQANDVQSLQIRKGGTWVPVKPIPDAFIVNVGDVVEVSSSFLLYKIYVCSF